MKGAEAWAVLRLGALNGGGTAPTRSSIDVIRTIELNKVASVALRNDPSVPLRSPATAVLTTIDSVRAALAGLTGRFLFEKGVVCRSWYGDPTLRDLSDVDIVAVDESARREMTDALCAAGWRRAEGEAGASTCVHNTLLPVDIRVSTTDWPDVVGDCQPTAQVLCDLIEVIRRRRTILIKDVNDIAALSEQHPDALEGTPCGRTPSHNHITKQLIRLDSLLGSTEERQIRVSGDLAVPVVAAVAWRAADNEG